MSEAAVRGGGATVPVLQARGVRKTYWQGKVEVPVLLGIDLDVAKGERVSIIGASGSGKSTLLHLMGGLDEATGGEIHILGQDVRRQNERERGEMRNRALGFVYQFHHLLPEFTALENVAMPLLVRRTPRDAAWAAASKMLEAVGLGEVEVLHDVDFLASAGDEPPSEITAAIARLGLEASDVAGIVRSVTFRARRPRETTKR